MRSFEFLVLALLVPAVVHADDLTVRRKVTLAECVAEALRQNPDVQTAVDEESIARSQRWESVGAALPRFHTDLTFQEYTSSYFVAFGPTSFQLHAPTVWTFDVLAIQPLTTLLPLLDQYHVRDLGVDIATIKRDATRRDTAFRVIEAYYRLLEAERLAEVAVQSVDQLDGQVKQANSFHDAGVVSRSDVLRAELALATAKQRVIQQRAQVALGRARLATTIGLPTQTELEPEPLAAEPEVHHDVSLEQAEHKASEDRVEIRQLADQVDQSKMGVRIAWYKLMPQVNLVAEYAHADYGVPIPLFEPNAFWVGGQLSWDFWDWGSNIAGIHEADAKLREARTARDKVRDQLDLEVRESFLNLGSAAEGTVVARAAVASAEENYRLVKKRYDANAATSFDVVDAENLLTQARAQLYTSTYDYLVARGALRRATGDPPDAQLRP